MTKPRYYQREVIKIKYVTVIVTAEDAEDEPNNQLETHLTTHLEQTIIIFELINIKL